MKKKIKEQFNWYEIIMDNGEIVHVMTTSTENAANLANDLIGVNEWKCITTV